MDVFKSCLCCLKQVDGSKKCGRCRTASYCSVECQKQHWKVHKNNCKDSNSDDSLERLRTKAFNYHTQGNSILYFKEYSNLKYFQCHLI